MKPDPGQRMLDQDHRNRTRAVVPDEDERGFRRADGARSGAARDHQEQRVPDKDERGPIINGWSTSRPDRPSKSSVARTRAERARSRTESPIRSGGARASD